MVHCPGVYDSYCTDLEMYKSCMTRGTKFQPAYMQVAWQTLRKYQNPSHAVFQWKSLTCYTQMNASSPNNTVNITNACMHKQASVDAGQSIACMSHLLVLSSASFLVSLVVLLL